MRKETIPDLHEFTIDAVIESALKWLFGPGVIVAGFVLLNFLAGWLGLLKTTLRVGVRVRSGTRSAAEVIRRSSARSNLLRLTLTMAFVLFQLGWVGLAYYVGNSISIIFRFDDSPGPPVRELLGYLRWDDFSKAWLVVSAAALLWSYVRDGERLAKLIAAPGFLYGFFGFVGGALNTITMMTGIDKTTKPELVIYMFTMGVLGTLYVIATRYALDAPKSIKALWSAGFIDV